MTNTFCRKDTVTLLKVHQTQGAHGRARPTDDSQRAAPIAFGGAVAYIESPAATIGQRPGAA